MRIWIWVSKWLLKKMMKKYMKLYTWHPKQVMNSRIPILLKKANFNTKYLNKLNYHPTFNLYQINKLRVFPGINFQINFIWKRISMITRIISFTLLACLTPFLLLDRICSPPLHLFLPEYTNSSHHKIA